MTLQQAIEKAIEGGWNVEKLGFLFNETATTSKKAELAKKLKRYEVLFIDKSFWESLGEYEGWLPIQWHILSKIETNIHGYMDETIHASVRESETEGWLYYWHRFIDHLAKGKDINSYFETL